MIVSGSLAPGLDASAWGVPAGTALRYERPAEKLLPLFPSYAVLDSDPAIWTGPDSWVLPGWAQIWIVLTDAPVTVGVRARRAAPLGSAMLFGGTSRAMPVTSRGGVTVVIDLSPIAWARLFAVSAESMRDQVAPLDELLAVSWADELVALLHGSDRATEVKGLLDDFFRERLSLPAPAENEVARITAALVDRALTGSNEVAASLGMKPRELLRWSNRYFGYGPTLLKRRERFLRALTAMMLAPVPPDFSAPPPGYYDATHFLRDGNLFLGLTPRRFLALPMPYLRAVLRARTAVCGAALPLLGP